MKFLGLATVSAMNANGNLHAQIHSCHVKNGVLQSVARPRLRKIGCRGSSNARKVVCNQGFKVRGGEDVNPRVQHGSVVHGKFVNGDKEWDCSTICMDENADELLVDQTTYKKPDCTGKCGQKLAYEECTSSDSDSDCVTIKEKERFSCPACVCITTQKSFELRVQYTSKRYKHEKEYDYDILQSSGEQFFVGESKTFDCKYPNPLNNRYHAKLTCAGKNDDGKDLWHSPPLIKDNRCEPKQKSVEEEGLGRIEQCWLNKKNQKACVRFPEQCDPFDLPHRHSSRFASWTMDDGSSGDEDSYQLFSDYDRMAAASSVRIQMQVGPGIELYGSYKFMCNDQLVYENYGKLRCTKAGWVKYERQRGDIKDYRYEDCKWRWIR